MKLFDSGFFDAAFLGGVALLTTLTLGYLSLATAMPLVNCFFGAEP